MLQSLKKQITEIWQRKHSARSLVEKDSNVFAYSTQHGSTEIIDSEQARILLTSLVNAEAPEDRIRLWREALQVVDDPNDHAKQLVEAALADLKHLDAINSDVATVVDTVDDPELPVSTFRAWLIGLTFSLIGALVNNLFDQRLPSIDISVFVAQLLAYPVGKLLEHFLPTRKFKLFGRGFTLNPGPFNAKEHMLITIMANVSFGDAYATSILVTQRLPIFYNQTWASNWLYQILLVVSTQIIGYGLAGIVRKSLVYPAMAVWPGSLAVLALNKSFHENDNSSANGWRITRLRWFGLVFLISGCYFFIPNYFFTALSTFNWMTWLAPSSAVLAAITGSTTGLGINPLPTLDYNIVSGIVDPLITPFSAIINIFAGMLVTGLIFLPAIWFSNTWQTAHFPIVANKPFDNLGHRYNVTRILSGDGRLDESAYRDYSSVYLSAANAFTFGGYFALYPATLVYAYLYHGTEIANAFRGIFGRGHKVKQDTHMRLMSVYKEVPEWWYFLVMLTGATMAVIMILLFPTDMPIWGIFFALAIGLLFIIPVGLITAVSNVSIGLNVLSEMVAGFAMPGRPLAMMIFKTYGTITMSQGLSFAADLKLGHYAKIPPRTLFAAQLIATFLSSFVSLGVVNWQLNNIKDFCLPHQPQKFSCPGANTFFTSSVIWGVIGPARTYGPGGMYNVLLWCLPIGALLPLPIYFAHRRWPNSIARHIHVPIFLAGFILWAPLNLSYITAAVPVAWFFSVYIKKRAYGWWSKYNYITATGLSSGIAIAGLIAFIGLQNGGLEVDWIGNRISAGGCDGVGCPLIDSPIAT